MQPLTRDMVNESYLITLHDAAKKDVIEKVQIVLNSKYRLTNNYYYAKSKYIPFSL